MAPITMPKLVAPKTVERKKAARKGDSSAVSDASGPNHLRRAPPLFPSAAEAAAFSHRLSHVA